MPAETAALLDSHCHLQDARLADDLDAVLDRARAVGVTRFVSCATREEDWDAVLDLGARDPGVIPFLGLHPWYVPEAREGWLNRLEQAFHAEAGPRGLGECGLDFAQEEADRGAQEAAFRAQLRLAKRLNVPLSIHCRRAWERLAALAREEGLPSVGAVIHAYSGSAESLRELVDLGFSFSFGCSLLNPENRRAAKALRAVPADRLLLETDSPDLAPFDWDRARPNEPANLARVLEAAAALRGVTASALAAQLSETSTRLFGVRP